MPRYTLETIIIVLVILWLVGWLVFPVGGNLIHLLLVLVKHAFTGWNPCFQGVP